MKNVPFLFSRLVLMRPALSKAKNSVNEKIFVSATTPQPQDNSALTIRLARDRLGFRFQVLGQRPCTKHDCAFFLFGGPVLTPSLVKEQNKFERQPRVQKLG